MALSTVARLSRVWFPSGGIAASTTEDAHSKLIRAGFLRQANAGMFHMLPLGHRVQDKVERLVSRHMDELLGELQALNDDSLQQT
jgi:prolyl-tRNA synthetase